MHPIEQKSKARRSIFLIRSVTKLTKLGSAELYKTMAGIHQLTVSFAGRVQGVFFRRGVKEQADKLGLTGKVENNKDGGVALVAEGPRQALETFLDWCYHGTKLARITSLHFMWAKASGQFRDFQIVRRGTYTADKLFAIKNLSETFFSRGEMPRHVAIIPDGNRRWARARKLETSRGHEMGVENTTALLDEAFRLEIPYLTFWGFSTENWNRSKKEVYFLMALFRKYLREIRGKLLERKIRFHHFGRRDRLPADIAGELLRLEAETADFSGAHFGLAVDYGGRDEIMRAIEKCRMQNTAVTEQSFSDALDTKHFPDPDLIIRTSGEKRTSGLMPWQGTYAELYFTEQLFPDFGVPEFRSAVAEYSRRRRNFGS